jgi:hypothetical protein
MRFSSIVSLVVVTASFALGGCAADAESTSSEVTAQGQAALVGHLDVSDKNAEQRVAEGTRIDNKRASAAERNLAPGMGVEGIDMDRKVNPKALGGLAPGAGVDQPEQVVPGKPQRVTKGTGIDSDGRATVAERNIAPGMGIDSESIDMKLNPNAVGGLDPIVVGQVDQRAPGNEPLSGNANASSTLGEEHADGCDKREP